LNARNGDKDWEQADDVSATSPEKSERNSVLGAESLSFLNWLVVMFSGGHCSQQTTHFHHSRMQTKAEKIRKFKIETPELREMEERLRERQPLPQPGMQCAKRGTCKA
jgi:hypothetical protein